jgi:hypothetical protein
VHFQISRILNSPLTLDFAAFASLIFIAAFSRSSLANFSDCLAAASSSKKGPRHHVDNEVDWYSLMFPCFAEATRRRLPPMTISSLGAGTAVLLAGSACGCATTGVSSTALLPGADTMVLLVSLRGLTGMVGEGLRRNKRGKKVRVMNPSP